jgi:hypothetical protein
MSEFPHRYGVYGLTVRSNRPLPGMGPARGDAETVTIDFAGPVEPTVPAPPFYESPTATLWHLDEETWLMRYDGPREDNAWTIRYEERGARMIVRWDGDWLLDDIPVVIQGPGLATALLMRDVPPLHACGVAVDGGAVLLMGDGGAGKSTTAAAFLRAGFPFVTDDLAPLTIDGKGIHVRPGYPRLRVFADSASAAGWDAASLPRLFSSELLGDKRFIEVSGASHSSRPVPLRAVYMLQPRRQGRGEPEMKEMSPRAAVPVLMENIFLGTLLDPVRRARAFQTCVRVAESTPVRSVCAADDLAALPRLIDAIVSDAMKCSGATA